MAPTESGTHWKLQSTWPPFDPAQLESIAKASPPCPGVPLWVTQLFEQLLPMNAQYCAHVL
jgi:hypothetical protein